jgi:hypothetical protein
VIGFRWRRPVDAGQFALALPAYVILGLGARREDEGLWELAGGYLAHAQAAGASALGFAPTAELATAVAEQAATAGRLQGRNKEDPAGK